MMRTRIHLSATVPNEAARRLAWFLGNDCSADAVERFAARIRRDVNYVGRLISGELLPGGELADQVYVATKGAVWRRDWRRRPLGGWFDRPAQRGRRS